MKQRLLIAAATTAFAVSLGAQAQPPAQPAQPAQPRPAQTPNADPYANNPDAGKTQFPLAAPPGKDSGAKQNGPAGASNQGAFDPAKWKYGTAFDAPAGSKIWNPAKLKLQQGGKVLSWRVFFRVSEILLLLLAGGLLVSAVDKLIALDVLPALVDPAWDTSAILDDSGRLGGLLASLTGYRARPALLPLLALGVYWAAMVTFLRRASR